MKLLMSWEDIGTDHPDVPAKILLSGHGTWPTQEPPRRTVCNFTSLTFFMYTLHSTLYTLHSTVHTLHFTLHSTLYILHSTLYTPHSTLSTPHFTLHTTLYTPPSTLYTLPQSETYFNIFLKTIFDVHCIGYGDGSLLILFRVSSPTHSCQV